MRSFDFLTRVLPAAGLALLQAVAASGQAPAGTPVYLDAARPLEVRVEDLLGRLTLEEKVGQLNMPCVYVSELGTDIPAKLANCRKFAAGTFETGLGPGGGFFTLANTILHEGPAQQAEYFNELQGIATGRTRLKIPLLQVEEGTHGLMCSGGTVFPEGLALGSTWDPDLIREIYAAAAREARAIGVHCLCTLVVEPNRDPRLGRNQEGYSEDPFLCSRIAASIVEGAQGAGVSAADRVVAVLCHYPGQSQPVSGLEQGAMEISERMLREVFLPPWTAGIREHGALGVMATYPAIDGVPAHASEKLLTSILRGELGFGGVVLSEGDGFKTLVDRGLAANQKQAGELALKAGVDVNITYEPAYMQPLAEGVRQGRVAVELIDRALRRVLRLKLLLGLFDNPYVDPARAVRVVHAPEHRELALRAAREGIILLKNEGGLLPLDRKIKSIAVIGPNADHERNQLGDYVSNTILQDVTTVLEGIRNKVSGQTEVIHVKGCNVLGHDLDEIARARQAAAGAEVAVVVLGENERMAPDNQGTDGEHKDVAGLDLTGLQEDLVRAVFETGTPTVVVLVNGRPLSVRWIAGHVPALLEAWICGEEGGNAVAEVLFGDCNPSGRLPVTVPRHVGQLPVYYNFKPSKGLLGMRRGYVDMSASPLFEFGYGLSYTRFEYGGLEIDPAEAGPDEEFRVSVEVRNVGDRAGQEVVQLYLRDPLSSVVTPLRELKGFVKVPLEPGEKKTVSFRLGPEHLSLLDRDLQRVVEPGEFEVMVGASCEDIRLRGSFLVRE
ncbi:MAG: glycoside hydrolase family 3 C-terminal domain-containing protein [Candidatus Glassbacteria bacterium]|nr:glycoside hydrolase family 3 C-terminal domain-containing protein [Candidatus Glassbacteria bacterium]